MKTTFPSGNLEESNNIKKAKGFFVSCKEDHVFILKMSLYALK